MFKLHKCIGFDDSDKHIGAYFALFCFKITADYYRSNRPFKRMTYIQPGKIKEIKYNFSDGIKLSFRYTNNSLPILSTKENKKMYQNPQNKKPYKCLSPRYSANMNTHLKHRWGKLNDYLVELNKQLPRNQKIQLAYLDWPSGAYFKDEWAEEIIFCLKRNIRVGERALNISPSNINLWGNHIRDDFINHPPKIAPTPSAPAYNPETIICNNASSMFSRKKVKTKNKQNRQNRTNNKNEVGKYVNINVNINIGKINCRIF